MIKKIVFRKIQLNWCEHEYETKKKKFKQIKKKNKIKYQ
jgi:hypothetical protein